MAKGKKGSIIILRPNEFVEFDDVQVAYEEVVDKKLATAKSGTAKAVQAHEKPTKEDDLLETWSIDSPLEEFIDVQVSCKPVHVKPLKPRAVSPKNGKAKVASSIKGKRAKRGKS